MRAFILLVVVCLSLMGCKPEPKHKLGTTFRVGDVTFLIYGAAYEGGEWEYHTRLTWEETADESAGMYSMPIPESEITKYLDLDGGGGEVRN
jgi:hypothetical protein